MSLISAGSISLDSAFKRKNLTNFVITFLSVRFKFFGLLHFRYIFSSTFLDFSNDWTLEFSMKKETDINFDL